MNKKTELPEAPASATFSIKSQNGFPILFTLRSDSGFDLLQRISALEVTLLEEGYSPDERKSYGGSKGQITKEKEYVEGQVCPKCGSRLVWGEKKDGSKFWKCETQRYYNGRVSGCEYVDWSPSESGDGILKQQEIKIDGLEELATEKQVEILKDRGVYEEGMTKAKASELIGSLFKK